MYSRLMLMSACAEGLAELARMTASEYAYDETHKRAAPREVLEVIQCANELIRRGIDKHTAWLSHVAIFECAMPVYARSFYNDFRPETVIRNADCIIVLREWERTLL